MGEGTDETDMINFDGDGDGDGDDNGYNTTCYVLITITCHRIDMKSIYF